MSKTAKDMLSKNKSEWASNWLKNNSAVFMHQTVHHEPGYVIVIGTYHVPGAGVVLRHTRDGSDDLFIPAGGQSNSIADAVKDLNDYTDSGSKVG